MKKNVIVAPKTITYFKANGDKGVGWIDISVGLMYGKWYVRYTNGFKETLKVNDIELSSDYFENIDDAVKDIIKILDKANVRYKIEEA